MWLLPSRGRPHLAARLFEKGNFQAGGLLILDGYDQHNYKNVNLPSGWKRLITPKKMYLSEKLNYGFSQKSSEPWYGILNDDHLPLTEGWDVKLVEALKRQPIVWPKDNYGDRISTPVFDGDLVRTLGWITPPEMNHFYVDDAHELLAECLGCTRLEDVTVSHEHVNAGRMKPDLTWHERPDPEADRKAYMTWCRDKWPEIRQRIGC